MKKSSKFPSEVQERAVRLVLEHQTEHDSQWPLLLDQRQDQLYGLAVGVGYARACGHSDRRGAEVRRATQARAPNAGIDRLNSVAG